MNEVMRFEGFDISDNNKQNQKEPLEESSLASEAYKSIFELVDAHDDLDDSFDFAYYQKEFPEIRDQWLKKVSRTFYLAIKSLPEDLEASVGQSYLVCRFLDSIEDALDMPLEKKREALDIAISCIESLSVSSEHIAYFQDIAHDYDIVESEKELLRNPEKIFEAVRVFPLEEQQNIQRWTTEMAQGMKAYAFDEFDPDKKEKSAITQLETVNDLEDYTYYVAGTVGELLTSTFLLNAENISPEQQQNLEDYSVAFGKALQYVNIIKDSHEDLGEGRCFIPKDLMETNGLSLETFFDPDTIENSSKVYEVLIDQAEGYLDNAIEYIENIPLQNKEIRLFCIGPVLLAFKTLNKIKQNMDQLITNPKTFKISKLDVGMMMGKALKAQSSNKYLKNVVQEIKG